MEGQMYISSLLMLPDDLTTTIPTRHSLNKGELDSTCVTKRKWEIYLRLIKKDYRYMLNKGKKRIEYFKLLENERKTAI